MIALNDESFEMEDDPSHQDDEEAMGFPSAQRRGSNRGATTKFDQKPLNFTVVKKFPIQQRHNPPWTFQTSTQRYGLRGWRVFYNYPGLTKEPRID